MLFLDDFQVFWKTHTYEFHMSTKIYHIIIFVYQIITFWKMWRTNLLARLFNDPQTELVCGSGVQDANTGTLYKIKSSYVDITYLANYNDYDKCIYSNMNNLWPTNDNFNQQTSNWKTKIIKGTVSKSIPKLHTRANINNCSKLSKSC